MRNVYRSKKKDYPQEQIRQRTFSTDFINNLLATHNVTSFEDFQRKVPTHVKIRLLKDIGYVGQNIIKTLIKISTTDKIQKIKNQHFTQLLDENIDLTKVSSKCNMVNFIL
jgi:hypothetical protein